MTAKEKADELVNKYYQEIADSSYPEGTSKDCALIAVDEIIETFIPKKNRNYLCEEIEFWQEVKSEIEKL